MKGATVKLLCLGLTFALTDICRGDAVFHAWIEAPPTVDAGSTFTASLWGVVSGSVLQEGHGGFRLVSVDMLASGPAVQFGRAEFPCLRSVSGGVSEPNALRGVLGLNEPTLPPFCTDNPLLLFEVEVTLQTEGTGDLELRIAPAQPWDFMLSWWVDTLDRTYIFDTDPGSSLIVTPAIVRVIPAPSGAVILMLGGLARARRRRR